MIEAYLDIETTGLSAAYHSITVIGVYLTDGDWCRFVQLVGEDVTRDNLLQVLEGAHVIYTYNGSRFDIPFIDASFGTHLARDFNHHDLMLDCWRNNLYGGFKAVETQLGIVRQLTGINGWDAVRLWYRYLLEDDREALAILLKYNEEDVLNLKTLKEILRIIPQEATDDNTLGARDWRPGSPV